MCHSLSKKVQRIKEEEWHAITSEMGYGMHPRLNSREMSVLQFAFSQANDKAIAQRNIIDTLKATRCTAVPGFHIGF